MSPEQGAPVISVISVNLTHQPPPPQPHPSSTSSSPSPGPRGEGCCRGVPAGSVRSRRLPHLRYAPRPQIAASRGPASRRHLRRGGELFFMLFALRESSSLQRETQRERFVKAHNQDLFFSVAKSWDGRSTAVHSNLPDLGMYFSLLIYS